MTVWNVYVGGLTAEFKQEVAALNTSAKIFWSGRYPASDWTPSEGIDLLSFDDETGALRHLGNVASDLSSPGYLALHPSLPVLYAAEFSRTGRLTSFEIRADGSLGRRASAESLGGYAVALSVHPDGRVAYVANWGGDGTLTAARLDGDGAIAGAGVITRVESRDDAEPHLHQVRVTPTANALVAADAGLCEVTTYSMAPDGTVAPEPETRIALPTSSAARHIEFHPSGRYVYVGTEQDAMLYVLEAEDGVPTKILNSFPAVPAVDDGTSPSISELELHPDGRTLYMGVRGPDCISIFDVDESGAADLIGRRQTLGRSPRAMRIDPSGRHVLVGHRNSGTFVVFRVVEDRGLEPVGDPLEVNAPSSMVFVQAVR
jgi:6-phosphogluconolactonase